MAPGLKRKSNYKSDHFVASDDDDGTAQPSKKGKTSGSDFKASLQPQTDKSGDKYWEISRMRRVTVNEYNGKSMINIREFYEKDGESLPGKKGISMTVEQYSALVQLLPQIETILAEKGESVPRPEFDGSVPVKMGDDEAEPEDNDDPKKANIEATSDEED